MTDAKSTKKRPYQQHGVYAVSKALESVKDQEQWLKEQGPVGEALKQLREDLIEKQGGKGTISPGEVMAIEGLVFCHMLMMSAGRFIGEQESPVNKSRRQLFPVVTQWLTLFREVRETAKDLNTLREKRPKPERVSLSDYLNGNGKPTKAQETPSTTKAQGHTPAEAEGQEDTEGSEEPS
jgi:hypothetical protein